MKRTAKHETLILDVGKWQAIEEIARMYAEERIVRSCSWAVR